MVKYTFVTSVRIVNKSVDLVATKFFLPKILTHTSRRSVSSGWFRVETDAEKKFKPAIWLNIKYQNVNAGLCPVNWVAT